MVRNHVPKGAGGFVIVGPVFNPYGLGRGDLNVIDVAAVQMGSKIPLAKRKARMF